MPVPRETNMKRTNHAIAGAFLVAALLSSCAEAGADGDSTGGSSTPPSEYQVSVRNYAPAPLTNVTINEIAVGALDGVLDGSSEPVEVTIARADSYLVTAEIDSSAGTVFSFSYELNANRLQAGGAWIELPSDYIALWAVDSDLQLNDDPNVKVYYGSFSTSVQPNEKAFLGVFARLGTSGSVTVTYPTYDFTIDAPESLKTVGGFYVTFGT